MNGFIETLYFWVAGETCTSFISGDSCNDPVVLPILGLPVCMVFPAHAGEEVLSRQAADMQSSLESWFPLGKINNPPGTPAGPGAL